MANKSGKAGWRACAARKTDGSPCQAAALIGSDKCRVHAGQKKAQIEERRVRTLVDRYIPPSIFADFERALNDPQLLDLNNELALIEARMSDVKRAMEEHHACGEAFEVALKLWRDSADPSSATAGDSQSRLGTLLEEGMADHYAWREIRELIDLRGRILRIQVDKLAKLDQFMTKQEATALGMALMAEIKRYLPDPLIQQQALAAVAAQFQRKALPSGRK